jgi:hypothetical protein
MAVKRSQGRIPKSKIERKLIMANTPNKPNQNEKTQDDVQIEPLSDQSLEDVSGGCPIASCSANVCSGELA